MLTISYPWIFLLLPLPFVLRKLARPYQEERPAVRTPFFDELVEMSGQVPGSGSIVRKQPLLRQIITAFCWILLVAALARPQWIEQPIIKEVPTRDLLLAVDLSGSMNTEDFISKDGNNITRLAAVKEVLDGFLERRKGDRVGLIFFGTAPFIQAPFTEDLELCRELLAEAQVGMAGPKTAFGDTIGLAINMFKESTVKDKLLIVLTDGNDTSSKVEPVKAAQIAGDNDIVIYSVAVGDPEAVGEEKLDEKTLQSVAITTDGYFFRAEDRTELEKIYEKIDALSTHEIETTSYRPRIDMYYWPLGLAILFSLLMHAFRVFKRMNIERPTSNIEH
ncbi:MAG: VWA domain-containing protein, partial [Thermodesulfobacteriota bacterium]|nr:VWA domain-containing protein [Thermodesulfobacteriota bacterium]